MLKSFKRLAQDRRGASAMEYGLILALIFVVMMGSISLLGGSTRGAWSNLATKVSDNTPSA